MSHPRSNATALAALAALALALAGCPGEPPEGTPPLTQPPTSTPGAGETPTPAAASPTPRAPTPTRHGATATPTASPSAPPSPTASEPTPSAGDATPSASDPTPTASPSPTEASCPEAPGDLDPDAMEARFVAEIYPLMIRPEGSCASCHYDGGPRLMTLGRDGPETFRRTWGEGFLGSGPDTILDRISRDDASAMPLGGPPWSAAERARLACFVASLEGVAPDPTPPPGGACEDVADPGRVTLHRLNRVEYDRTLADLLGDDTGPAQGFPVDDRGYGFDNIADVLTTSPLLVEKNANAVRGVLDDTLGVRPAPDTHRVEAETLAAPGGNPNHIGFEFGSNGELLWPVDIARGGAHRISVVAYGKQAGEDPAQMTLSLDGEPLATFEVPEVEVAPGTFTHDLDVPAGAHTVGVAFINDYFNIREPQGQRDRNLIVDWIAVEGPLDAAIPDSPRRSAVMICDPEATGAGPCAREILAALGRRAWRRSLTGEELDRLGALLDVALGEGDDFEAAIRLPLRALLLSPRFFFRVELDPDPESPAPHALSGAELASRLSYFLWSSMPDDALLDAAEAGDLRDPALLAAQVERMLADPKASALTEHFAGQWLHVRALAEVEPDPERFPDFDPALRAAMAGQTEYGFTQALSRDLPLTDLLDTQNTVMNARLAEHYGLTPMEALEGDPLVPVTLMEGSLRGGILGQGTFQTITSHPTQTSPVLRGKWALTQLLCAPPPPPPANVMPIEHDPEADISQREELEAHRADPACASCHEVMDPIGFGLDNFDPVGQWRIEDDYGFPIDAGGVLPPEQAFDGPEQLIALIKADPDYPRCVAQHLLTYATGRGMGAGDDCALDTLKADLDASEGGLRSLVHLVVQSPAFGARRGEPTSEPEETP